MTTALTADRSGAVTVELPSTCVLTPTLARALLALIVNSQDVEETEIDTGQRRCLSDVIAS
jgi:hypothetical protein